ncbi:CpsD/CapB family tyrosine-protein kinase [Paenibacillus sp.]|uniref:CpsD/CapB family tyrosine-protein kinase n=1 Tax=Paenibacillus sp. TaxID=58172 RepID=UPI002D6AE308|nr:CpsD/CapB family tyrosine-protein kinase [Paenibacillus sp.]HZG86160.1 CpsD/CapB family tyrosine-protein kinase [Paenibacillus sp.]
MPLQTNNNQRKIITVSNPKSPISESYVRLRTNIELSAVDEPIQVIMVTSANPGEGKSTTAANLAVVYAQADKQVLLIDADLRKPTMHHHFMLSNRNGLTSVLTNQVSIGGAIRETSVPNLRALTSGPIPPNPSELLSSKRMESLIAELRSEFDIIIIDTPPTLAVADAQIISTRSDGAILVLNSGNVKRELALKAKQSLEHAKARILGVVLNNVDRKNADSYYYYYYGEGQ